MADVDGSLEQSYIVGEKNDLELLSQNKLWDVWRVFVGHKQSPVKGRVNKNSSLENSTTIIKILFCILILFEY